MHRVLVLAFLGLMLASAARAADVAPRRGYAPPPPRCANFSGFYLGGQLGWGYYDTTFSDRDGLGQSIDTGLPNSVNATTNRVNLGPLAGYTFQSGCTVYGFEADWSWTSLRAAEHSLDGGQGVAGVAELGDRHQQAAMVRHAAGPNRDRGGQSDALRDRRDRLRELRPRTWSFFEDASAIETSFRAQKTLFGWTGGVGTEWAWTPNWSIKSEVLYMRFASDNMMVTGSAPAGVTGVPYRLGSQDSVWITRFGLNYRWGGR